MTVNWLRPNPMAEARKRSWELDDFEESYFEAALWSTVDAETGEALDNIADVEDIARLMPQWYNEQLNDIAGFRRDNWQLLELVKAEHGATDAQNGHDFWLTRERHGVGFWDRGYGDVGDELSKEAEVYGNSGDELSMDLRYFMEQEG